MYEAVVERVQRQLIERGGGATPEEVAAIVRAEAGAISDVDVLAILRRLRDDSVGVGVLEPVLALPGITDVVVNGPEEVWCDRGRGLERAGVRFSDDAAVRRLAARLAVSVGARLDDAQPFADGRLRREDGTSIRFHAVLSPPSESGTCLSLRVLRQATLSMEELVRAGTIPPPVAEFLRDVVVRRCSYLIVGGTGTGKTTLLSALLAQVPDHERLLCIEDTAELAPAHPHVVNLVARRANVEGRGAITLSALVRQGLRMRPDRIVVGEIRGAEIVDLFSALNTGHEGGAGTLHANSLAEVSARIEALAALGGLDRQAAHSQWAAAVRLVLVMRRTREGKRILAQIGLVERGESSLAYVREVWHTGQDAARLGEELSW
ncbi:MULTISPECIES: TadA family conjugal transfer-associated ATPase [unclassified Corynebacterium]|uniref:TadA family conjugal transfer-associated ATPase n=1 Tax=unclassified Corynebacterium TaxID=2624378 RepID=UPI0029CA0400|nr:MULTISPECIES: TadA family conjugal transfer-associated ATPase [unclassified Corynebacterium]WPF67227.1 TadA family conjugal transfer-associated ATPase [Corynebacterium sp. 22KM0430]WPF69716.1 TadA family conjugal transfer-associated ATPase [Corynebacterium sp. 21KM1197]